MTETVVNKLRLKNIIDNACDEILKTEYREIRKRATLSLLILIIAVLGVHISIGLMAAGFKILIVSGVSKILIQRIIGSGLCVLGVAVLISCIVTPANVCKILFKRASEAAPRQQEKST